MLLSQFFGTLCQVVLDQFLSHFLHGVIKLIFRYFVPGVIIFSYIVQGVINLIFMYFA